MVTRFRLARLVRLRVLLATCVSACLVTIGLVAVPSAPASAATVTASGPIASGMSGLCLDDYQGSSTPGTIADLASCQGGAEMDWNVMSDGTLQINGLCLDIYGASTAQGTPVDLWTCNGGWNQQWTAQNGELVNPTAGQCLDDPGFSTTAGTQMEIWSCNGGSNQQWTLPGSDPVTFTNAGGDLTASVSDSSLSANQAAQVLGDFEQGLGLSAGASLNSVFQAFHSKMGGVSPNFAPPAFNGGTLTASGNTFTATIPAGDIPASTNNLPGWLAGTLGALIGGLTALVVFAACMVASFFAVGLLAPWMIPTCTAISFFFWSFVGIIFFDSQTGVPLNEWPTWQTILAYSFGSAALGVPFSYVVKFIAWFLPYYFGAQGVGAAALYADIAAIFTRLAGWLGGRAAAAGAADVVLEELGNAAPAVNPGAVAAIAAENGLPAMQQTGTVTSGFAGNCMDAYGSSGGTANSGQVVTINTCNGNPAQNWSAWSDSGVSIYGKCLDTKGGTASDGGTLTDLEFCNGSSSQVWNQVGNTLVNQANGDCLDDQGGNTSPGTRLQILPCDGSTKQEWLLPGNSGNGGSGGGGGGGGGGSLSGLPCDVYAQAGTPCVAAYSTTRALYSSYDGPLYQVQVASGGGYGATKDIYPTSAGGDVNAAPQDSFCGLFTCIISEIYDQSGHGNNLPIEGPSGAGGGADQGAVASVLPVTIGGHEAYGVDISPQAPGVGYRDDGTSGIAVNGQPEGAYMVTSGTHVNNGCCFDFGNVESNANDNGAGHMDAINVSTTCWAAPCTGSGPWVAADMENGIFQGGGNGSNTANTPVNTNFVTAMLGNNGQADFDLAGGSAQSGGLTTFYNGPLPTGYAPMHQEGGIVLGTGGDGSNRAMGSFFEGAMTSGVPSSQAQAAVQANIVAAGYGGLSAGHSTGGGEVGQTINMTAAGNGKCVDILGDDTGSNGTVANIWDCQSYAVDQHWTQLSNDSLTTLGRCLDLDGDGTAPGTKVELWNCNGLGGQQFVPQPNGSLYNPQSGLCLDDPSGSTANGTVLQIWNCLGNSAQNFTFNDGTLTSNCGVAPCLANSAMPLEDPGGGYASPPAGAGTITLNGGQCVNVGGDDGGHDGTIVDVWTCDTNAVDQQWTLYSTGSLKNGMGQCLDVDGNGTAPGTKVELWDCNGVGGQVWEPQSNGSLLNPQSGLCLDDPSGNTTDAEQLQIWTCNGNPAQVFHVNGSPNGGVGSGPPVLGSPLTLTALNGGKCIDVLGNDTGGDGTVVDIWDCQSTAADQHWTLNSNDSLETMGRCLDLDGDGTAPGTKVELWDCNGVGGQQFVPQSNGSLYNPQSGLCLDDPSGNTANGTVLQIWNCLGDTAQVFTFSNGSFNTSSCGVAPCVANSAMPLGDPGGGYASPPAGAGTITLPTLARYCVNVGGDDGGHDGTIVDVWTCDTNAVDQQWTLQSNGSLKNGMGQCLDIDGNGTAPGTKVELWDCNGVGGQVWVPQSNGSLLNPQSGLCLDDPSGITTLGEQLQIWTCNGNQAQEFHLNG